MNILATVVNLIGHAWAVAADGTRRELKTGDRLRGDEMLVTEPGARIDLDFGNNQQLTFLGDQQQGVAEAVQMLPAQQPPSAPSRPAEQFAQPETGTQAASDRPEGYRFVQLIRIQEIIEADGITPLTVARIQEMLRPLGMSLPDRVYDLDEWREHRGGDPRPEAGMRDNVPPSLVEAVPPQLDQDGQPVELDLGSYFTDQSPDLTYRVEGLPPGLSYDPDTGRITGTIDRSASQGGPDGDGSYPITVTVSDPAGNSTTVTFPWTVDNPPPVANDDRTSMGEDDPSASGNVLTGEGAENTDAADNDPDGDTLTVIGVAPGEPSEAPDGNTGTPITGEYGQLTLNPDGSYTYEPDPNDPRINGLKDGETITDTFTYTLSDGEGGTDTATLVITINGKTDGPPTITPEDGNGPDDPAGAIGSIGHTTVHERGLTGEDDSHIGSGSISIRAPDGLAGIEVGGTLIDIDTLLALDPADPGSHITISTEHGTLVITGFDSTTTVGGVPTEGELRYQYTLKDAIDNSGPDNGDNQLDNIPLVVIDQGGDKASGTLVVNIIDDVPEARDDRNAVDEDSGVPATGNVLGGGDSAPTDVADRFGADADVTVSGIISNNVTGNTATNSGGVLVIEGQYGTLTIQPDGSYSYQLDDGNPEVNALKDGLTLDEVFTYTLTDGDGDSDSATLTITINGRDDNPPTITPNDGNGPDDPSHPDFDQTDPVGGQGHATVHEAGLTGTDDSHITTGSITLEALDGLAGIKVGGRDVSLTELQNLGATPVVIDTDAGKLILTGFTPSADVGGVPTAGELTFRYELETPQTTPAGPTDPGLNSTETIPLEIIDAGGGRGTGDLVINIIDDVPGIASDGAVPTLTVDETTLGTPNTVDFSGAFSVTEGADGASVVYSLEVDSSIATGLTDTETGQAIVLTFNPSTGAVEGRTEGSDELAFTVSVDAGTGEVTLLQERAFSHPDSNDPDDPLSLPTGSLQLVATVTDGDGDSERAQIELGDKLIFLDDGPGIASDGAVPTLTVDETTLGTPNTVDFSGAFSVTEGADGASVVYSLEVDSSIATGLTDTETGQAIVLTVNPSTGAVEGRTEGSDELAFTVSVDATGEVTLLQERAFSHPDSDDPDDPLSLPTGSLQLVATVTDGDGDSERAQIELGDKLIFLDDGPRIGAGNADPQLVVNESDLGKNDSANFKDLFAFDFGADGQAATGHAVFGLDVAADGVSGLVDSATGQPVTLTLDGNVVQGTNADGDLVFTITLDPTTGEITLEQIRAVEHPSPSDKDFADDRVSLKDGALSLTVTITDADGDTAQQTVTIGDRFTFLDDGPSIEAGNADPQLVVDESDLGKNDSANFNDLFEFDFGADGQAATGHAVFGLDVAADGVSGLVDSATGQPVTLTLDGNVVQGTNADGDLVFTITLDPTTGEITLEQIRAVEHPLSSDKDFADDRVSLKDGALSLTVTITDADGDTAQQTVTIGDRFTFLDDGPSIEAGGGDPQLEVNESDLGKNDSANFKDLFEFDFGADGQAATGHAVFGLDVAADGVSGLVDSATGQPVTLTLDGNVVQGTNADGDLVFTITLDPTTGEITLEQIRAVEHPLSSDKDFADDRVSLTDGALSLTVTITDADGDTAQQTVTIGDRFTFLDDGPSIEAGGGDPQLEVNESDLGKNDSANFNDLFEFDFGADGQAATGHAVFGLDVAADGVSGLVDSATGQPVTLTLDGNVVQGTNADGDLVFTITLDPTTGEITLEQIRAVEHPLSSDKDFADDRVSLKDGALSLTVTITDADGDTAQQTVTIGDRFTFRDDGPTWATDSENNPLPVEDGVVHEKHLVSGSANADSTPEENTNGTEITKNLPINFGADGAGDVEFAADAIAALENLGLTSGTIELSYERSEDGHTITATAGARDVFDIVLSVDADGNATYTFTLKGPLDHPVSREGADETYPDIELPFSVIATDRDGDSVSLNFNVRVTDDTPPAEVRVLEVDEDGTVLFSSADVNTTTTRKTQEPKHGDVDIRDDGTIIYTPDGDYRGEDSFTYTVTTAGGETYERTVKVIVNPVADKPLFQGGDGYSVTTPEDTEQSLGLKLPEIKDKGGQGAGEPGYEDYSELLGAITLTPAGAGYITGQPEETANTRFFTTKDGQKTELTPDSEGKITIVIVGEDGKPLAGYHVSNIADEHPEAPGTYYLTREEYEAITAYPAEDRHENFEVKVEVTSYEVDENGEKLEGVAGATGTQTVTVDVLAVTDSVGIEFETPADDSWKGESSDAELHVIDRKTASITLNEDSSFNLTSLIKTGFKGEDDVVTDGFKDVDGSETRCLAFEGLPPGTTFTDQDGNELSLTSCTLGEGEGAREIFYLPKLTSNPADVFMHLPEDFSGDLSGLKVIIVARDSDSDNETWVPERLLDEVTLNLHVRPVAGDVNEASSHQVEEDTAVAFLSGIRVTDQSSDDTGGEVITEISFVLPSDANGNWTLTDEPASRDGWSMIGSGTESDPYVITFDETLSQAQREDLLKEFKVTPPGHSSLDARDWVIKVTTVDRQEVNGETVTSGPVTVDHKVTVNVTPVAESADSDSNEADGNDVTLNDNHQYTTPGYEDEWFKLSTEPSFSLRNGWSNEDGDEYTYARLTPELVDSGADTDAIGSMFRYSSDGGTTWHEFTYVGEPSDIWIPMEYLDTLEFKGKENFSGTFRIKVEAITIDYDDDNEPAGNPWNPADPNTSMNPADHGGASIKVSGEAWLNNVEVKGVADDITLALNGHARGKEDQLINLDITAVSSDASEIIDLTISDIPVGATIHYTDENGNRTSFTAKPGDTDLDLPDFNGLVSGHSGLPLWFKAPEHRDGEFSLKVTAKSSELDKSGNEVSQDLTIRISVEGVADDAEVILKLVGSDPTDPQLPTFTEAELDEGTSRIKLSDLFDVTTPDTDGSEVVTARISGLPEGFKLSGAGATLVQAGTGGERVWTLRQEDLDKITIDTPPNFSGKVTFQVAGVTTERGVGGGDSKTMPSKDVSFIVTPSPDAITTTSATLVEDEITSLGLAIVHQNGDTDETLGRVFIPVDYGTGADFTLYLGDTELSSAGLTVENISGVDYYVIPADRVEELGALGAEHLDRELGHFDFKYEVIDGHYGSTSSGTSETELKDGTFTLNATPVTDKVNVSIDSIAGTRATTTTEDNHAGDDAAPDTATLTHSDEVTVNLRVSSEDTDGSEHLIRVLIEGVPVGVTVEGAQQIDENAWVLVYEGIDAQSIGNGLDLPVTFVTGPDVASGNHPITMTVQVRDRGNESAADTHIEEDSVTWHLHVDYTGEDPLIPPVVGPWEYNGEGATEDTPFQLSEIVTAGVTTHEPGHSHTLTVTLTDVPPGTEIEGMTRTIRQLPGGGTEEVWTASVTVPPGGDAQAALEDLLDSIRITPPADSNENNSPDGFSFGASLSASVAGGGSSVQSMEPDDMVVAVTPETDPADIIVVAGNVDEGSDEIPVSITVSTGVDGAHGEIVGGEVYVKVDAAGGVNGGVLTLGDGTPLDLTTIEGETYYVVPVGESGGALNLVYTPAPGTSLQPGDVTFTVRADTREQGAAHTVMQSVSDTSTVELVNNGVTVNSDPLSAGEAPDAKMENAIELTGSGGLSVTLNDDDGSESISAVMLSGLPNGFLVYVGASADDAALALSNNAGGDGGGNTWVLSSGALPGYVAILPPAHWSGTLEGLKLIVESGESALPESLTESFDLADITVEAVADGIELNATRSFGTEGDIIPLNLNASMKDPDPATAAGDDSIETTSLKLTGLGQYAEFFIEGKHLADGVDGRTVTYSEEGGGTYTITGLSQNDLDKLGFKQARAALTDQDGSQAGIQIGVEAWTVESGNGDRSAAVDSTLTLNIFDQISTNTSDTLLWTGHSINGRGGDDTVQLRFGESLDGTELAANLRNIEVLDLGVEGGNRITSLSAADVLDMTDDRNLLKILGDEEDSLTLAGEGWSKDSNVTEAGIEYAVYTSGNATVHVQLDMQQPIID